jgi:hypothetical protein
MMDYKVKEMAKQVAVIKKSAIKLKKLSCGIQAVDKNTERILASVKMLEINISDLIKV